MFLKPDLPQWHNTQALRYLEKAQKEGLVTSKGEGKKKRYRLTRAGLIQNVYQLVEVQGFSDIRHVLLTYYFIRSYQERIISLIQKEGSGYSKALQLEVEHLFDHELYLSKQLDELKRQIQRLKVRIEETKNAENMAIKMNRQGEVLHRIIDQVSLAHPYELDNQKPMAELFKEIEPEVRFWEITRGNNYRAHILWETQLQILEAHLKVLKDLSRK